MTRSYVRPFASLGLFATLGFGLTGCIIALDDDDGAMMDTLDEETESAVDDDAFDTDDFGSTGGETDAETDEGTTGGTTTGEDGLECSANVIMDPSFEAGTPSSAWVEKSEAFGTPMCDGTCSDDASAVPSDGDWWIWFGGMEEPEAASMVQTVTFSGTHALLSFDFAINAAAGAGDDTFTVSIDGEEVFMASDAEQADFADYTTVEIDVSAYSDGESHEIRFDAALAGGGLTNFFLDDVALIECEDESGGSSGSSSGGDDDGSSSSSGSDTDGADESGSGSESSGSTSGE